MLGTDGLSEPSDFLIVELDHRIALGAMQVVMGRVAEIVLVGGSVRQSKLAQQASFDQQPQRPVNRRAADSQSRAEKIRDQFVRIEVLVMREDVADQDPPGLCELLAPDLQELAELINRRLGRAGGCRRR